MIREEAFQKKEAVLARLLKSSGAANVEVEVQMPATMAGTNNQAMAQAASNDDDINPSGVAGTRTNPLFDAQSTRKRRRGERGPDRKQRPSRTCLICKDDKIFPGRSVKKYCSGYPAWAVANGMS
jgi:hypothetical protein